MTVENAINKIFDVYDKIKDALSEDGPGGKKVTIGEIIGLVIVGVGLVPAVKSFGLLVEDWKSRDEAKKAAWLDAFSLRFDLPNDELEKQIESLVQAILLLEGSFVGLSKAAYE